MTIRKYICQVIPVALNTADLLMKFGIKETECAKADGGDPQTCAFKPGFFVVRHLNLSEIKTISIFIVIMVYIRGLQSQSWRAGVLQVLDVSLLLHTLIQVTVINGHADLDDKMTDINN